MLLNNLSGCDDLATSCFSSEPWLWAEIFSTSSRRLFNYWNMKIDFKHKKLCLHFKKKHFSFAGSGKRNYTSVTGKSAAAKIVIVTPISNKMLVTWMIFIFPVKSGLMEILQVKKNSSTVPMKKLIVTMKRTGNENIELSIWDSRTSWWMRASAVLSFSNNFDGFSKLERKCFIRIQTAYEQTNGCYFFFNGFDFVNMISSSVLLASSSLGSAASSSDSSLVWRNRVTWFMREAM